MWNKVEGRQTRKEKGGSRSTDKIDNGWDDHDVRAIDSEMHLKNGSQERKPK